MKSCSSLKVFKSSILIRLQWTNPLALLLTVSPQQQRQYEQ